MKVLTTIIVVGIIIWYLNYISPENKKERKKKRNATAKRYKEKMALTQENDRKNGDKDDGKDY
jgi:Fe2+ transport system protein B